MAKPDKKVVLPRKLVQKARAASDNTLERGAVISDTSRQMERLTLATLRAQGSYTAAIRRIADREGSFSTALFSYVQVAATPWKVCAYSDKTGEFDTQATLLARTVMNQLDTIRDYSEGYSDIEDMETLKVKALREVAISGAIAPELVLNQSRLPARVQVVAAETLDFKSRGDGTKYPVQVGKKQGGGDIELNIPTFFYARCHPNADTPHPRSMFMAALDQLDYFRDFMEDTRKVLKRAGQPRLVAKLIAEAVQAGLPPDVRNDDAKLRAAMDATLTDVQQLIDGLSPEDALILYDFVETDILKGEGEKADYKPLIETFAGLTATSMKSHPSILGMRLGGSQSLSNTESLIHLKMARALQVPVEAVFSRLMTLAVRLYGAKAHVKVTFDPIDLRPKLEQEAQMSMKQARIIEQLSMGWISDDEAAMELGAFPRPAGAPDLSGTMFHQPSRIDPSEATPNNGPQEKALTPDGPSKAGGRSQ